MLDSSQEDPAVLHEVRVMLDAEGPSDSHAAAQTDESQHAGSRIGRYDVIARIGVGSSGEVYSGRDRELDRPVALKFMSPVYASLGSAAQRFIREAQAASALNHPNIVTVHEVITWKSLPVIVMELVAGTSLRSLCAAPMPLAQAMAIGRQIMEALAFAHANGIVHRDLKPENVMVRNDGYVKLLDLGLARRTIVEGGRKNVSSTAGLPVGTLRYMSPEQCRGESAIPASDVFAAGIVFAEMIAGRHPFDADSPLDTAHAIAWLDAPPLTQQVAEVPQWVDSLVARMLAKDASARPTAEEVVRALAEERPPASGVAGKRRLWRRRLTAGLVVAAALAIALSGALWLSRSSVRTATSSELQITPLASLIGVERNPSVSPDGTHVAFAYTEKKEADNHIYIKSLADGALVQLTSGNLPDYQPVFSPDGTSLVFLRPVDGRLRIMVMPAGGGNERQVAEIGDLLREMTMLAWGPNGRNLFYCDRPSEFRPEVAIFEISLETGARRQLTFPPAGSSDWMPQVSPDGRTLGFARILETSRGDLWAIPLAGGRQRRLTASNEVFVRWAWASNGRELLISYRRSNRTQLWRQPVDGGPQVRVAGMDDQVRELSVAGHARVMVYGPVSPVDYNVWWYPLPPSKDEPKPLIASSVFDGDARYSPDGRRIVFVSERSGQANLWVCSSDGSDVRQITSIGAGGFWMGSPSWSPDGKRIAFDLRAPAEESSVYVMEASGGKPTRMTGPGPSDILPVWSRDGRWIYFASDRRAGGLQIWKIPSSGGEPAQVTRDGGLEAFESPDGRYLYYTKRSRAAGFWRMPLQGGAEARVPGLESITNRYWEASPEGIYFVERSHQPVLRLFHFSTGEITRIIDLPVPPSLVYRGLSISPDSKGFLYLHPDIGRSNLMLVTNFQ